MASRQNQGLQIALIFFVVTTILLSVVVYFTATAAAEAADERDKKKEELREMQAQRDAYNTLSNLLMAWVGDGEWSEEQWSNEYTNLTVDPADPVAQKAIQYREYFDQDMFNFSADYTDPKGWRTLPGYLLTTIKSKNSEISNINTRLTEMRAEFDAGIQAAQTQVAKAEQDRDRALQEKAEAQRNFNQLETDIRAEQATALATANQAGQRQQTEYTALNQEIQTRDDEIGVLSTNVTDLAAKVDEYEREEFEVADGKITRINQNLGVVWINVGTEDNLPRNAVFGIYGQDESTFNPDGMKGKVRIKRILGPHSAEAEILDQSLSRTLLVGDKIFTPTWKPGRVMRYALAGLIDFDGDGQATAADLKLMTTMIEENGGKVVASVDPTTGDINGELDALTNFLVLGDAEPADPSSLKAVSDSTSDLRDQAEKAGVATMYAIEVMDSFGYGDDITIERVGSAEEGRFVPRRPPARPSDDGAF